MKLDPYITHTFEGLEGVNEAIKALHGGDCLRAVVHVAKNDTPPARVSLNCKPSRQQIDKKILKISVSKINFYKKIDTKRQGGG